MIDLNGGLVLIGPDSEWFWTAFSGILVAISLLAVFRQLRLQTGQKVRDDIVSLDAEYSSERFLRYRLQLAVARRDGVPPEEMPQSACEALANYWGEVGLLTRDKYFDKKMTGMAFGHTAIGAWFHLEPWIQYYRRRGDATDDAYSEWEWLVHELIRDNPELAGLLEPPPSDYYTRWVKLLEEKIAVEVALRN